jgi:hypothetical protein
MALPDLLQSLGIGRLTGVLNVETETPGSCRFRFQDGELVAAEFGSREGRKAVRRALTLKSGAFRFVETESPAAAEEPLGGGLLKVLMEAAAINDELQTLNQDVAGRQVEITFSRDLCIWGAAEATEEQLLMLRILSRHPQLEDFLDAAGVDERAAIRLFTWLQGRGFITLGAGK